MTKIFRGNPLESKLPQVGTTIFTIMSRLAEQHGAINLSQGFPDFQPPARLIDLVGRHLAAGRHQYAPMTGVAALREALAGKLLRVYGVQADPETEITVTPGATEALFAAIHAVVRPGDEVVVFDPAYDSYEPAVTLAGGVTVHVPLAGSAFRIDWDRLAAALNGRTRLVIINSPHNPTGALLERPDLDRLAELLRPYGCYVLSDEVYEHIVFDGARHASVLAHSELAERSFAVFSFGKTYHATGWKTGYCVAPASLSAEFRKVHQYVSFAAVTPLQYALADYLEESPEHYLGLPDFYAEKRDLFVRLLGETRFTFTPSRGTYFQLVDYSAISDLPDTEFARWLTIEHGVAVIPISVFYATPVQARLVRFCFAKESATLERAAERLAQV
ncbi:MAG TPA: pyridoxal phosphate-dependent aminotransferase [Gammaproteobacteria bacterium]|nr:pyridoxal phosphate-dependent aminotransferase [Gammaproteobacteria bacterium]